jgi:hypothetical protein
MSSEGGDTGGGGYGGGSDGGGFGKGGSNSPTNDVNSASYDSGTPSAYASTGSSSNLGLPSEITTGSSSPSLDSLVGSGNGLNLGGPGPVGGDSPALHGGLFSTSGDNSFAVPAQDAGASGLTSPSSGGGTSASAFAAPEGVAGTPQLSDFVKSPQVGNTGAGQPQATSAPGQGVFDLLEPALNTTASEWGAAHPAVVPTADTSSAGTGGGTSGTSPFSGLSLGSNPLGTAAAGAGLLNNMITGNTSPAYSPQLNAAAGAAGATGAQQTGAGQSLQQYIATGQLPQGYEDQIQQAAQAAKQQIISNYANRGLPTDPTKNSTLAQELAQVDARLPAAREQLAATLAQTGSSMIQNGLQATGIQSGVYQTLANLQNQQNQQRAAAIANFAASLNGGIKPKAA